MPPHVNLVVPEPRPAMPCKRLHSQPLPPSCRLRLQVYHVLSQPLQAALRCRIARCACRRRRLDLDQAVHRRPAAGGRRCVEGKGGHGGWAGVWAEEEAWRAGGHVGASPAWRQGGMRAQTQHAAKCRTHEQPTQATPQVIGRQTGTTAMPTACPAAHQDCINTAPAAASSAEQPNSAPSFAGEMVP